ncbi:MAG TPA: signal peptidase I [Kofleriaceae bacterium]|nr:signal peptidase I [Kofleriaceae bacterium]
MIVVRLLFAAWAPLLALWGRWKLAAVLLGAWVVIAFATTLTVFVVPMMLVLFIVGWVFAIRAMVRGKPERWHWQEASATSAAMISIGVIAFVYLLGAFKIPSAGMSPTLQVGDHLMVEKLSILWRAPSRGDVVVFIAPNGYDYVQRIVAVGGDVVAVKDGMLAIDGAPVPTRKLDETRYEEVLDGRAHRIAHASPWPDRPYDPRAFDFPDPGNLTMGRCEDASPQRMPVGPRKLAWPQLVTTPQGCRVPDGTVFMMGDNRDDSADSRYWGPLPIERIEGRVVGIWMPASRMGSID